MGIKTVEGKAVITAWFCPKHGNLGPDLTDVVNHRIFDNCYRICDEIEVKKL